MNGYVLVRTDGKFVARSGHASSYTTDLAKARVFRSRKEAENERCIGNETVRSVGSFFGDVS